MDEALKRAAERVGIVGVDPLELAKAKAWLTAFERAMESEEVPERTRRQVINCLVWGHPDGDTVTAREEMARWDMARQALQAELPQVDPEQWRQLIFDSEPYDPGSVPADPRAVRFTATEAGRWPRHTEETDRGE